jgi:integration host factor subunit beta
MTKSELIATLVSKQQHLGAQDVELAVKSILDQLTNTLEKGGRVEIRGFGSFSVSYRPPRVGRNPKTGASVPLEGKHVPHFKPGKELRDRVNESAASTPIKASLSDDSAD